MKQQNLFANTSKSYGGELLKTRKGRRHGRPIDTKHTMHLVLRSSQARGKWSFLENNNQKKVRTLVQKFSLKYGIKIISLANVGNHLHFHIKIANRQTYKPFIRALTGSIAMAITGFSRWNQSNKKNFKRFWDYRPFTRVVVGFRAFLKLKDYIQINQLESQGYVRKTARFLINCHSTV